MSLKKKMGAALATTALGAALIGGGTFAIFTSSASNSGNTFAAGTLSVNLDKPDGTKYFNISNIAPGDSGSSTVKVSNSGSLELRYDIAESLTGALASGTNGLKVHVYSDAAMTQEIIPGPDNNRVLSANGGNETLYVKWELPKDAGNEYQGQTANLGLTVNAEQTANN
jgi:predicted ribosomally synthesized peptide with SipW-like signal peptide